MKKWLLSIFLACAPMLYSSNEITIQAKAGFFFPSSSVLRNIYNGGGIYGPEITWRFMPNFDLYGDVMYYSKSGRSLGKYKHTRIKIVPASLGLRGAFVFPSGMEVFLAGSAKYIHLNIYNNSPYVKRKQNKEGVGWGVKGGYTLPLWKGFHFDFFIEYFRKKFNLQSNRRVSTHEVDVGGVIIGGAVAYRF